MTTGHDQATIEIPPRIALAVGDDIDPKAIIAGLENHDFREDDRVDEPGEYVLRGSVLDLFDPSASLPVRIRFAKGKVTSLTRYDPLTQLQVTDNQIPDDASTTRPGAHNGAEAAGRIKPAQMIDPLAPYGQTIRLGDLIIHEDHGLGRVEGLEHISVDGKAQEMIELVFSEDTRRFIPVAEMFKIWRYGGDEGEVALDKLNGSSWQRRRKLLDEAIAKTARHMLKQAHRRSLQQSPTFDCDMPQYERFCEGFPFAATPDQERAFADVEADLAGGTAMNRLIVGDVAFGKTEVALRAAAIVALGGAQVALIAPTNILVSQHFDTFVSRFGQLGIKVAMLTGGMKRAARQSVLDGLANGDIDIVIGTSAVAGKSVHFSNVGLVIVDEEHRLGARDKKRLRSLSHGHILHMSATPIPRTLLTAMVGLQDISVPATPPASRKPVATSFHAKDEKLIQEALTDELGRGGQAFVVVPKVSDVEGMIARVQALAPDAKVAGVHGKMKDADIDETVSDFSRGLHDILVSTTVIEIGLDIPGANCMIVIDADRFGMAQLHQLRGRVGRGGQQATMLLLGDCHNDPESAAAKRLRKLVAQARLGAGFSLSLADLDMRGAGDLAGDSQNGHVALIGADLYHDLLETAVAQLRSGVERPEKATIAAAYPCSIPSDWLPRADSRLEIYYRVAHARSGAELRNLRDEFDDRFGKLPKEVRNLMDLREAALKAAELGIKAIRVGTRSLKLVDRAAKKPENREIRVCKQIKSASALKKYIGKLEAA